MTTWLTTDQVLDHLGISREALVRIIDAPVEPRPWVLYAGAHRKHTGRYKWRADRVDDWFEEACRWRACTTSTGAGSSAGETEAGAVASTGSGAAASGGRTRSRKRSRTRSNEPAGTNLVELAGRLLSR